MSAIYDNWERLVDAVLKKDQLWQLFHEQSRSPSIRSEASDFSSSVSSPLHDLAFDFSSLGISSHQQKALPKLVFISNFSSAFEVEDVYLASSELLGRGTFGSVYTAAMENGVKFVVKRLNSVNISELEFKRQMEIVGNVRHENVAALRAYYSSEDERLMLHDYYSDGSVFALLHGQTGENQAYVYWETRVKIAVGAARGIADIHTRNGGKLVHGNIKSSNIFLNPLHYGCVSDLGFANMIPATFMPTAHCYDPEIKKTQNVSQASDVYSFGILLLELITRKSPVNVPGGPMAVNLVKLVSSVISKVRTSKVFDADLLKHRPIREDMVKMLQIGISCVAKSLKKRPKMFEVVKMLEDLRMMNAGSSNLQMMNTEISDLQVMNEKELIFFENDNLTFDLEDLLRASAEVLGKGTFGTSYKATFENGDTFTVKRLKDVYVTFKEFQQHAEIIGKLRHENVDKLRAYYFSRDEQLMVYDYLNQGSVFGLLHANGSSDPTPLDWESRLKIAVGAARGIAYIHKQDGGKLVHGNIKSSNVFLNGKKYGLVSDAGIAKVMSPIRQSVMRPLGHFAPEVKDTSSATQASDVYSFGVVLFELVSGRPSEVTNDHGEVISLVRWIQSVVHDEWTSRVFDVKLLRYQHEEEAIVQLLQIAMDCVDNVPERRPRMSQVVNMLEEISGMDTKEQQFIESRPENLSEEISGMDTGEQPSVESRLEDLLEDLLPRLTPQDGVFSRVGKNSSSMPKFVK